MAIKLVVFDIAGTTVKDEQEVSKAFQAALKKYNYDIELNQITPFRGYQKTVAIKQILLLIENDTNKITPELISNIHQEFTQEMIRFYQHESIVALPHVEETFAALRTAGIQVGINTGFSRDIANTIVTRLQWREKGLIDHIVGSDEVEQGRPHPYMIQKIMKAGNITDPLETAKVGDTEADVREGQNAGCKYVIGVTTGAFTREQLEPSKPTHIIDNIAQVIDIINQ